MKTIPLSGRLGAGLAALVDDEKYDLACRHRWWYLKPQGYAYTQVNLGGRRRRTIYLHTLVTGKLYVDHADGDGLNCQLYNLRDATTAQNGANQAPIRWGASAYKGVCLTRNQQRWRAQIKIDGRAKHLGCFDREEDAARAYDKAAFAAWGEYARLNFPRGGR